MTRKHITRRYFLRAAGTAALGVAGARFVPSRATAQTASPPYTFFFTHYESIGDPKKPEGVRYHSNGRPFAKAPNGDTAVLLGKGAWDPKLRSASGGGQYVIKNAKGTTTMQGTWRVTDFIAFEQLSGWWEAGYKEFGWQGPPGSVSFSGFLTLRVNLGKQGTGVLMAWCIMPTVAKVGDHTSDGVLLVGPRLNFTNYKDTEMSDEGVMFYSTDPTRSGYTLDAQGHAFLKKGRP